MVKYGTPKFFFALMRVLIDPGGPVSLISSGLQSGVSTIRVSGWAQDAPLSHPLTRAVLTSDVLNLRNLRRLERPILIESSKATLFVIKCRAVKPQFVLQHATQQFFP